MNASIRTTTTITIYLSALLGGISQKDIDLIRRGLLFLLRLILALIRRYREVEQEYHLLRLAVQIRRGHALAHSPHSPLALVARSHSKGDTLIIPEQGTSGRAGAGRLTIDRMAQAPVAFRAPEQGRVVCVTHPILEGTPYPVLSIDCAEGSDYGVFIPVWCYWVDDSSEPEATRLDLEEVVAPVVLPLTTEAGGPRKDPKHNPNVMICLDDESQRTICVPVDLTKLTWNEVRKMAVDLKLSAKGKRADIEDRIKEHLGRKVS